MHLYKYKYVYTYLYIHICTQICGEKLKNQVIQSEEFDMNKYVQIRICMSIYVL